MEIKNQIAKKQTTNAVTYESSGTQVTLSPGLIKAYLVSGGGAVTDQEVMMFLGMCQAQKLNPFNREAYLVKYGSNSPATMIVGKDVFLKRARRQKDFAGFEAGIVVLDANGDYIDRPGTFYDRENEGLVGGWAKVHVEGYAIPIYESVSFDEYAGRKADGSLSGQWAKMPATMIRKVALCQALREAFPEEMGALYGQEEMSSVSSMQLDETKIDLPEEAKPDPLEPTTIDEMPDQTNHEED